MPRVVVISKIFEIDAPMKVPSVNYMYKCKTTRGKSFAWLYKDPKVQAFQDVLIQQAQNSDLGTLSQYKDLLDYVNVQYIFLLDKNLAKRDVSNMIKMTEDAIVEVTGIDDSCHRKVTALKALSFFAKKEYIICKYEIVLNEDQ